MNVWNEVRQNGHRCEKVEEKLKKFKISDQVKKGVTTFKFTQNTRSGQVEDGFTMIVQ